MLTKGTEFVDKIDALIEGNMVAMRSKATKHGQIRIVWDCINELGKVHRER